VIKLDRKNICSIIFLFIVNIGFFFKLKFYFKNILKNRPDFLTSLTESETNTLWIYYNMFSHCFIWLSILVVIVVCMVPDVICLVIANTRRALKIQRIRSGGDI